VAIVIGELECAEVDATDLVSRNAVLLYETDFRQPAVHVDPVEDTAEEVVEDHPQPAVKPSVGVGVVVGRDDFRSSRRAKGGKDDKERTD
jgi:hypothetical protein